MSRVYDISTDSWDLWNSKFCIPVAFHTATLLFGEMLYKVGGNNFHDVKQPPVLQVVLISKSCSITKLPGDVLTYLFSMVNPKDLLSLAQGEQFGILFLHACSFFSFSCSVQKFQ
jgi:hypothetical protein